MVVSSTRTVRPEKSVRVLSVWKAAGLDDHDHHDHDDNDHEDDHDDHDDEDHDDPEIELDDARFQIIKSGDRRT